MQVLYLHFYYLLNKKTVKSFTRFDICQSNFNHFKGLLTKHPKLCESIEDLYLVGLVA